MKYFGITTENKQFPKEIDVIDFCARLFLSPQISVEQTKKILLSLENLQNLQIEKFIEITDKNINYVVEQQNNGVDIESLFGEKIRNWIAHFEQVSENDLDYLAQKYSIKRESFSKEIQTAFSLSINSPRALANYVKQWVKGQDAIVEQVSVPFFQHIENMRTGTSSGIKSSFLLVGNTGVGKSEILRRFCEIINVPIIRINTSNCIPNGWRGEKITDHIGFHINDDNDIIKMQYAVIAFNEFDKITHYEKKIASSNGSEWDADMQRDILKFFDKDYEILIEKNEKKYKLPVNNLLLCFDGAFSGIEKIIESRKNLRSIGFNKLQVKKEESNLLQQLNSSDLEKFGYMPELLGRIGSFFVLNPITEDLVYEIITTASDNILKAHKSECERYGFHLEFTDKAIRKISKIASETTLGLRSVKNILTTLMAGVYYDCNKYKNTTLIIDEEHVNRLLINTQMVNENNKKCRL